MIAILSKDAQFTPGAAIPGFSVIYPGLNLINTSQLTGAQFTGQASNAFAVNNISSGSFMRSDQNTSTTGSLGVASDVGLSVGTTATFNALASGGAVSLTNSTNNSDLNIYVNKAGVSTKAIGITGTTGSVTFPGAIIAQGATSFAATVALNNTTTISAAFVPNADNTVELGGSAARFANVWSAVFQGTTVNLTGNVTTGNVNATGNITARYLFGNGSQLTGMNTYSNIQVASYISTYSGNITTSNVSVSGNVSANTLFGNVISSNIFVTGNIIASYLFGNGSQLTGMNTYSNIQTAAYLSSVGVSATSYSNVNVAAYLASGLTSTIIATGFINTSGNVSAAQFVGSGSLLTALPGYAYSNVNVAAYTQTQSYTNYSNVNVAAYVTAMGVTNYSNVNLTAYLAGGITSTGFINTSGNVSAAVHTGGAVTVTGFINTAGNVSGATVFAANLTSTGVVYAGRGTLGEVTLGGDTNGQLELGQLGRLTTGTPYIDFHSSANSPDYDVRIQASGGTTGLPGFGNLTVSAYNTTYIGNILPQTSNVYTIGSTTLWWNRIYSVAINAAYADLAERFAADAIYLPGTVVELGGSAEVTLATQELSEDVFGVISTNAAYLMNGSAGDDNTHPPIALSGRVPVRVIGLVKKGDRLVSAGNGLARVGTRNEITAFNVIGRSLEDKTTSEENIIEAIVKLNS